MIKFKTIFTKSYIFAIFFPVFCSAQTRVIALLADFRFLIGLLPRVIFGLAMIYFFWQGAQFILNAGDEKYREEGKKRLVMGLIILFVLVSIYGILNALQRIVDL
jgi:hypothetical protein